MSAADERLRSADRVVERAAEKLDELADTAADKGGSVAKLAPKLEEDADFLRKVEPSKVAERVRGERPPEPALPRRKRRRKAQPSAGRAAALAPVGAALLLGVVVAKLIDWRSYAEPRI